MALEKSGKVFIAYQGTEFGSGSITDALNSIVSPGYTVKFREDDRNHVVFAKIVFNRYLDDRDPYFHDSIYTVNGYNQSEIEMATNEFSRYGDGDSDRYHYLMNHMYGAFDTGMFKKLGAHMHFCSAIYDRTKQSLIAGVTEPNSEYTHLYYGYTSQKRELMYSNNKDVLKRFCDDIQEMPENSYMKNGELFNFNDEKIAVNATAPLIKNTRENAHSLIEGLNALLIQITNESVRAKIEANLNEYLASDDPKKKISDFIGQELDLSESKANSRNFKKSNRRTTARKFY